MDATQQQQDEQLYNQAAEQALAGDAPPPQVDTDKQSLEQLGLFLRTEFDEALRLRRAREEEWIKDLRQFKGQYDPETLAKIGKNKSRAFIRLTRSKVRSTDARLADTLFPSGDKNWTLTKSPVPELSEEAAKQYSVEIEYILSQYGPEAVQEKGDKVLNAIAEHRASKMSATVEDQLAEINYPAIAREVMHSGHLYGTGILKGPMTESRTRTAWQRGQDGVSWNAQEVSIKKPSARAVSIWNIVPDPYAISVDECEYIYERHVLTKHELRKLAKKKGFMKEVIEAYIIDHPKGDLKGLLAHERDLRDADETKDALSLGNRYEVLERWGFVDGLYLREAGETIDDSELNLEFEACIWVLGDTVIRAYVNPFETKDRPYKFYYFEKDETSIWGISIGGLMRDPQSLYNACIRMMADNAAISAGPQIEANKDLLLEDEDTEDIFPFRIWQRRGKGADANYPAIRTYEFASHTAEFMKMATLFQELGDETTTIPRFTYGQITPGVARTVGGLSMLMGQSNISLKDIAKNWDDGITTPFINGMVGWNMQFNDDVTIKGDYDIVARGASSLVAKELRSTALQSYMTATANPIDAPFINRPYLLRETAKALDLDSEQTVKSDKEIDQVSANAALIEKMGAAIELASQKMGITPQQLMDGALPTMVAGQEQQPPAMVEPPIEEPVA